ncbi:MAG: DUF4215 domain-containing protein [Kofleriaceae bacterium]
MLRTVCGVFVLGLVVAACGGGNNATHACGDGHVDADEECDDGNVTSNDGCSSACRLETSHCGDGITEVATEQCDDGNNVSGDGCSANCQRETVAPMNCGNGALDTGEACDDHNMINGDGCSSTCTVEAGYVCTGTPSMCSIPPMATGGTCAAPEEVTLTGTTALTGMALGDTTVGTSMVPNAACAGFSTGDGNDNIWSFTITDTRDVRVELDPSTDFDAAIRVMTTPCDPTTGLANPPNPYGCADENFDGESEILTYSHLAAGTYYVVVDSYDPTVAGAYAFTITATPSMCGNGVVDGTERCDDHNTTTGDGCDASCYVEAGYVCTGTTPSVCTLACGNGLIDADVGEDCDDGDLTGGDGCSATCHTEPGWDCGSAEPSVCVHTCGNGALDTGEECDVGASSSLYCTAACVLKFDVTEAAEPNDTTPKQLQAVAHQIIKGTMADFDDIDLYTFTLTAPATVEIESYDSAYTEFASTSVSTLTQLHCDTVDDELRIFGPAGDVNNDTTALFWDDQDGDFNCAYIGPHDSDLDDVVNDIADINQGRLPAGTYILKVNDYFGDTEDRYLIDLRIEP